MDISGRVASACARLLSNEEGFTEVDLTIIKNLDPPLNVAELNALTAALMGNTHVECVNLFGRA